MFGLILNNENSEVQLPLVDACESLGVSRSGYYQWKERQELEQLCGKPNSFEMQLKDRIHRLVLEFPGYGYRRITHQLNREGFNVNHKRILNLMRLDNLLCIRRHKFIVTTDSRHSFPVYPNLAGGMFVTDINQLWVADITYIRLEKEFVYLAVILDAFSRKCIGWELDRSIDTQLTLNALHKALRSRWNKNMTGLIHHSDQGVQYASYSYTDCLKEHNIQISMSRKANPYDNAFAESFMKTLKYEEVYLCDYRTFNDAYERIPAFIDDVYNQKRLHSSIGYLPPNEFELELISNPPKADPPLEEKLS